MAVLLGYNHEIRAVYEREKRVHIPCTDVALAALGGVMGAAMWCGGLMRVKKFAGGGGPGTSL